MAIESHLSEDIAFLVSSDIPWDEDAAALFTAITLIVFGLYNYKSRRSYYFHMKPLYYKEYVLLAIVIPSAFGFVIARVVFGMHSVESFNKFAIMRKWFGLPKCENDNPG